MPLRVNDTHNRFPLGRTLLVLFGIFVLTFALPNRVIHLPIVFWAVITIASLCLVCAFGLLFAFAATTLRRWLLSLAAVGGIAWFAGYSSACITAPEEERGRYNSPLIQEVLIAPGFPGVLLTSPGYELGVGEIRRFRFSVGTANAIFWLIVIPITARCLRSTLYLPCG
jgi:hypothetical protein